MICARDTSGQRTLFYRYDSHTFAAATEIQQLLQAPRVPVEPDHERIRDSLVPLTFYRNVKDQERTYYRGIWSVPAGHVLTVDATDLRLHQYWELTPPAEIRYASLDDYAEHFLSLFSTVIEDRLRTSWPVGATLSGGMDSSSIVCTAQEVLRTKAGDVPGFTSFSIVYPGLECDERPLIEMVQDAYGFNAVYIPRPTSDRLNLDATLFQEMPDAGLCPHAAHRRHC
jgi:asparagine synthase (glutamine-hydrolysing)